MRRKATALLLVLVALFGLGACTPDTETYYADTCPPGYRLVGTGQCYPFHTGYYLGHYYPTTILRATRVSRTRTVSRTSITSRRSLFGGTRTTIRSSSRSSRR